MEVGTTLGWRMPGRIAYVVSHSFPYSSNGYAVRTHGVARALAQAGYAVLAINRPGRPWDMPDFNGGDVAPQFSMDGVRYLFLHEPSSRDKSGCDWQKAAAGALEEALRVFKPSLVLAASNWENALPALTVARKLGLPFFYETRGFWEISRLSREPQWAQSDEYRHAVEQETLVANSADRVFTLNALMRDELARRGVAPRRIALVPNAWDAGATELDAGPDGDIHAALAAIRARHVVGYVGSFNEYEGLDDLVRACAALRQRGMDLALLLVGSSSPVGTMGDAAPCSFSQVLVELAKGLDFGEHLHLPGRVAPDALGAWYRRSDIIVVPRKPYAVSELVSPIKVLGAAAQGKALLVSDVAPLQEFVQAGVALSFAKGDMDDLAKQIASLLQDPGKRQAMGERARRWIKEERNFDKTVQPMLDAFAGPSRKAEWDCIRHKFF